MKILNEKHLSYFATCDSRVDKEGWLLKKGDVNKSFQRRWFSLKGNLLFYFDKKGDREPNGVIILEGYTVELCENIHNQFSFMINFKGLGCRSYILSADSQASMESWMVAITSAGYDYMKLLLADLQSRLNTLNSLEASGERRPCAASSAARWSGDRGGRPLAAPFGSTAAAADDEAAIARVLHPERENPFKKTANVAAPVKFHLLDVDFNGIVLDSQQDDTSRRSPVAAHRRCDRAPDSSACSLSDSGRKDMKSGRNVLKLPTFHVPYPALDTRGNHNNSSLLRKDFLQLQTLYGKQIDAFLVARSAL